MLYVCLSFESIMYSLSLSHCFFLSFFLSLSNLLACIHTYTYTRSLSYSLTHACKLFSFIFARHLDAEVSVGSSANDVENLCLHWFALCRFLNRFLFACLIFLSPLNPSILCSVYQ